MRYIYRLKWLNVVWFSELACQHYLACFPQLKLLAASLAAN